MKENGRSLFWIEPSAFAGLLEKVTAEPSGSDGGFAGVSTNESEEPAAAPAARPIAAEPATATPVTDNPVPGAPQTDLEIPEIPAGPLEDRLEALLGWLKAALGFVEAFVADKEGLALAERGSRPELVAVAAAVSERWAEVGPTLGLPERPSLSVDLEDDERLHLLIEESRWGRLSLGWTARKAVARRHLAQVSEVFRRTVKE